MLIKNFFYAIGGIFLALFMIGAAVTGSQSSESNISNEVKIPKHKTENGSSVVATTTNYTQQKVEQVATVTPKTVSATPLIIEPVKDTQGKLYYLVTNVVDGDTIKVDIAGVQKTVRLIGVNTPETVDTRETVQCFGIESSNLAKSLLLGKKVLLENDPTQGEVDKYGRVLAYAYLENGLLFNKYIIEQGYAYEYTYDVPYIYQIAFKNAQKEAQENLRGLWSPATCNGVTTQSAATSSPASEPVQTGGKYYTSSHYSAKLYYPETCEEWKSLSPKYLQSFDSLEALLSKYNRSLSPQCK